MGESMLSVVSPAFNEARNLPAVYRIAGRPSPAARSSAAIRIACRRSAACAAGRSRWCARRCGSGQALIFTPYLIHGLAFNKSDTKTRMALEMRFNIVR